MVAFSRLPALPHTSQRQPQRYVREEEEYEHRRLEPDHCTVDNQIELVVRNVVPLAVDVVSEVAAADDHAKGQQEQKHPQDKAPQKNLGNDGQDVFQTR